MAKAAARTVDDGWGCELSLSPPRVLKGDQVTMTVTLSPPDASEFKDYGKLNYKFSADDPRLNPVVAGSKPVPAKEASFSFKVPSLPDGDYEIVVEVTLKRDEHHQGFPADPIRGNATLTAVAHEVDARATVTLQRAASYRTDDQGLWVAIRNRTLALDFNRYQRFINTVFCTEEASRKFDISVDGNRLLQRTLFGPVLENPPHLSIFGPYAYIVLKLATQIFLTLECGVMIREDGAGRYSLFGPEQLLHIDKERIRLEDPSIEIDQINERLQHYLIQYDNQPVVLPYLKRIVTALLGLDRENIREVLPYCYGILQHRLTSPSLLELIWSYWHEEGMLAQTMNTIALRFQNRGGPQRDPLVELELDPLRPLNNLIWGFIQDEHNRLTVPRRASEYQHQYGLSLVGRAMSRVRPADIRSKFIEAFHNLLYRAALFYREDADTTVIAEAFPLLNALKEVHLILAEGAHNQFGDLPWTARCEMLTMQWMLARPEMREFLRGRYMVPYQEGWMGAVDSMKRLQGWTDTTITHFHELAVMGERILLSIRYGDWVDIENIQEQARNWARYWKPEIQRYMHAYQAVTGVDLMADVVDSRDAAIRYVQPSMLLQRRLTQQRAGISLQPQRAEMALPAPQEAGMPVSPPPAATGGAMSAQRRLPRQTPKQ
jgi:hypothetical protein